MKFLGADVMDFWINGMPEDYVTYDDHNLTDDDGEFTFTADEMVEIKSGDVSFVSDIDNKEYDCLKLIIDYLKKRDYEIISFKVKLSEKERIIKILTDNGIEINK